MKWRIFRILGAALACSLQWVLAQSTANRISTDAVPVEVAAKEATKHFLAGRHLIHSNALEPFASHVNLKIVVTPIGVVQSARPVSGGKKWYSEATALAMTWQYIPFARLGTPVYAAFPSTVSIVPPERRPDQHVPFPEIRDWRSLQITLRRTVCYGTCPSYRLTIFGDGRVVYTGAGYVQFCGEYSGHIPMDTVRQLVNAFKEADYFNLFDRYGVGFTELPTYITSITFDDKTKSVLDYGGVGAGMPEVVDSLENSIDRLAGPKVWVQGMNSHYECENSFFPLGLLEN